MTKVECATSPKGYTFSEELCEGNDCVCSYYEQPSCEDIGCEEQKNGRCMTKVECKQYATSTKGYTCTVKFCQGIDCVCSYYEQPCKDNGCKDQEGKCMTKEECVNFVTSNEGYSCTDKLCQGKDCVCMKPTKGSSSSPNPEVKKRNVI